MRLRLAGVVVRVRAVVGDAIGRHRPAAQAVQLQYQLH